MSPLAPAGGPVALRGGRRRAAALAAIALALAAATAHAADPFYERLLRNGLRELERGDHATAVRSLRIAAFGLLDEPERRVEALVPLALAEAALGDSDAFAETFGQIVEVEDRFGAYAKANLPADQRRGFEERAAALIPVATLERSSAFRAVAEQQREDQIMRLAEQPRREALAALIAEAPDQPRWLLLLGRVELEDRNRDRAVELATRALALSPDDQGALCLRGLAQAGAGRCAAAVPDLEACAESRTHAAVAAPLLSCLGELARWQEARERLDGLAPGVRDDRLLEKIGRRISRQAPAAPAESDSAPAEAPADVSAGTTPETGSPSAGEEPPPGGSAEPAPSPAPAALSAADGAAMTQARALLTRAKTTSDLDEAAELVRDVAERNPDSAEAQYLAGEVAYRGSRWQDAAQYFRRGGDPGAKRAELSFYMAVAYYETGAIDEARAALARALPGLKRTPFVESYVQRILASPAAP